MVINNNFVLFFDVLNDHQSILLNFEPISNLLSVAKKQNASNEIQFTWLDEDSKVFNQSCKSIGWPPLNINGGW